MVAIQQVADVIIQQMVASHYLTIRLRTRDFYEVIVDEGFARIDYQLIGIESE